MKYKKTITACYIGYIVQAIVNNFAPLLFVTFQAEYALPVSKITALISVNFTVQLTVDLLSAKLVDKLGYRKCLIAAHVFAFAGLCMLAVLPDVIGNSFAGLLISVITYAVGGGLIEVLISPVLEACPTEQKEKQMSLLHSFYCWGHVGVVLISTVFFSCFGVLHWKVISIIWSVVPVINIILFSVCPLYPIVPEGERKASLSELFTNRVFWILFLMMFCAGASELTVSQWASAFAERGLGVSKTVGDIAGPMAFASLMGISRLIYGKLGDKIDLEKFMIFSSLLCVVSYLVIGLSPSPAASLAACAVCGFSVGIMWPGTFSRASAEIRGGGTAMFALFALAGDLGCAGGPYIAGSVADSFGGDLKRGLLCASVFPSIVVICVILMMYLRKRRIIK